MARFTRGLCMVLACAALWVSQATVASPSARAEMSWVAGAEVSAARRGRVEARPRATLPARPSPRLLRAHAAPGPCRRHAVVPARGQRIYIKHCVLQR
jgi:hypothetical protein